MTDPLLAPENTVRDIAAKLPGAARIFREADISFCCGGERSLREAAEKAGLNLTVLTTRLQDLIDAAAQEAPSEAPDLIAHIVRRYHDTHREELGFLIPLAHRVETVHGDHDEAPLGLTQALMALRDDLDTQMSAEESALFPAILRGEGAAQADRGQTAAILGRIADVTHSLHLPLGACGSWTALYTGLRKLCDDMVAHLYLEDTVLFPQAAA